MGLTAPRGHARSPTTRSANPRLATKWLKDDRRFLLGSKTTASTTRKLPLKATTPDTIAKDAVANDKYSGAEMFVHGYLLSRDIPVESISSICF